ncbi:Pycsar system effector family protein [Pseudomonas luteola]
MDVDDDQKIRISGMWDTLKRYDNYIGTVNFRSGLITSFSAAVFGGILLKADQIIQSSSGLKIPIAMILLIIGLLSILSIYWVIRSIWPNLNTNKENKNKHSLFFFGSVAKNFSQESYARSIKEVTLDDFEKDLAIQVHEVAEITLEKFSIISKAATFVKWTLLFLLILLILLIIDSSGVHLCVV